MTWVYGGMVIGYILLLAAPVLIGRVRGWRGIAVAGSVGALSLATSPSVPNGIRLYTLLFVASILAVTLLFSLHGDHRSGFILTLTTLMYGSLCIVTAIHGLRLTVLAPLSFSIVLAVLVVQKFTPSDAKDFRLGIVILALAQSFMAGIEFVFSGEPALWGYGRYANGSEVMLSNPFLGDEVVRTQGTLGHPIVLATLLVVALLIVALGNDIRPMVIRVGIASILAISIVLTGTRSAILALVISIVIVKVFRRNAQNRWRNIVVVGSISCAVLFFDFGLRALWNNLERSGSYTNRLGSLQAVPDIFGLPISRIFLGGGFGSESQLYRQGLLQQNGFGIVDNQIVTTMVTGGLFGLMMLFSVLVFAYRKADQLHMAILTSLVIMMFSFDFLKWPTTSLIFFVFCAMAVIERSPHTLLASVDPKERNENTKVR